MKPAFDQTIAASPSDRSESPASQATASEQESASMAVISHIKRFVERWTADATFRKQLAENPQSTIDRYGIQVDLEAIRGIWDMTIPSQSRLAAPLIKQFLKFARQGEREWMQHWSALSHTLPPHYLAWRERQRARADGELLEFFNRFALPHLPFAIELNQGCSVGCWFCGVSAAKLTNAFRYTHENAQLWQDILTQLKEIFSTGAGLGFCYFATDPLDNPDYEQFCEDFHRILGTYPKTTTALATRDLQRTKALVLRSQQDPYSNCRFSVLSTKMLDQIHAAFTAEELLNVRLVLQTPESLVHKAEAGRASERRLNKQADLQANVTQWTQGTICCVSGFLLNMVERSIQLISPCQANEQWPKGYRIYDRATFTDAIDLKQKIAAMMAKYMSLSLYPDDRLQFETHFHYELSPQGFNLVAPFQILQVHALETEQHPKSSPVFLWTDQVQGAISFKQSSRQCCKLNLPNHSLLSHDYLQSLGNAINGGSATVNELAIRLEQFGISSTHTLELLNFLFRQGVFLQETI